MTRQEIVFCKSVFEKVKYNFDEQEIWSAENYYKNLSFINIKTLKSNKKTIERCIKGSKGFLKLFKNHLFSNRLELIENNGDKVFVNDAALNGLCNICEETLDKIIHSENKGFLKSLKESDSKTNFEFVGIDGFITPPFDSRLITANRNIEIRKGNRFIFTNIFKPYFRYTSKLIVYDRFLRNRNRGFSNLLKILDLCEHLSKCEIHTMNYKNNEINKFDIEFEDFEKELKHGYGEGRIEIFSTKKHRRKIITDDFEIKIDPGLDFVDKDFICKDNDVDIEIKMLEK